MDIKPATTLGEVSLIDTKPLRDENWSQYVPTDAARGASDVQKLISRLQDAADSEVPCHILFAGHSGCGKSTELERVRHEIAQRYLVRSVSVVQRYSLHTFNYKLLLFLIADALVDLASGFDTIEESDLSLARSWFDERYAEEVKTRGASIQGEAGARLSFLKALFAGFHGKLWSSGETKERAVKYVEERLDHLVGAMQQIVDKIHAEARNKKVLLIIEDLDKLENRDVGRNLFFEHRPQLLNIPCTVIYTFPIRLWYDNQGDLLNYPSRYFLPMIPVSEPPPGSKMTAEMRAHKAEAGRKVVRDILFKRIERKLITEDAVEALIDATGGVLRDFLYLLRDAALEAKVAGCERIELAHANISITSLRHEYANRLVPDSERGVDLSHIHATLGQPDDWPKRDPDRDTAFNLLLQNLCILEYNGDRWYDLHPLVKETLRLRRARREGASP